MLFNACAAMPARFGNVGTSGDGTIGFVSGVIGTLVGNGRTAPAKVLRAEVPVVDHLSVRIVTDNIVIQFMPSEKRAGLTIERRTGSNTQSDRSPNAALNGEWGLAIYVQSCRDDEVRSVLIDFGYTAQVLLNNMGILKVDASTIDALVLSHGHYDHLGSMFGFLNAHADRLKPKTPLFIGGEDCFCLRRNPGGSFGALDRKAILDAGLTLMMASEPAVVADHAFTTGRIGQTSFEAPLKATSEIVGIFDGFGCFPKEMPAAKNTGTYIPDDFDHEIGTSYVVKDQGLVVLTSCSHRGVINTVRQAMEASGVSKVHAVIGGFHIVPPLGDDYINRTIEEFRVIDPDYLITGHCTGDRFYDLARAALGDKVIRSAVGTRFVFGADSVN